MHGSIERGFTLDGRDGLRLRALDLLYEQARLFAAQHFEIAIAASGFRQHKVAVYNGLSADEPLGHQVVRKIVGCEKHLSAP